MNPSNPEFLDTLLNVFKELHPPFSSIQAHYTHATHTYILLIKSNSIEKGWGTANPARVKRETFIEKQLEKQLEKLN